MIFDQIVKNPAKKQACINSITPHCASLPFDNPATRNPQPATKIKALSLYSNTHPFHPMSYPKVLYLLFYFLFRGIEIA